MIRIQSVAAALFCLACVAGTARPDTPHGRPGGFSAAAPTGLALRSEQTRLTFHRDSARVDYSSRATFSNPGPTRAVELHFDFTDVEGQYDYATGTLSYGEPAGAPTFAVTIDGRPVVTHRDVVGDTLRFRWSLVAPSRRPVAVEVLATFPWTETSCAAPDYTIEWRPADDSMFDVSGAAREMVFRFVPAVSFLAVDAFPDTALFERGTVTWRWRGHDPQAFNLYFDSGYADDHAELFPGRYPLPADRGLDNSYFEVFPRGCEETELSLDTGTDSLSTPARACLEEARSACRSAIRSLSESHRLAALDTTSSGQHPPFTQPGLSDVALSRLNAVERRNLRYAVGLLWALDARRNASDIWARIEQVTPEH